MEKQVKRREPKTDQHCEIHEFGSCPLRSQPDYGERTASVKTVFSPMIDCILGKLSTFEYGCYYTDGSSTKSMAVMDEKDGTEIHVQSPKELWEHKCGMCHDASVFVDAMLEKEGIEHKCYYIYSDRPPHYPTHSFVVALCADGFKRIIDVFSTANCVYPVKSTSYERAARWRLEKWIDLDNGGRGAYLFCGTRMPNPKCSFMEFSETVMKTFREIG